jgi:excisionase family DNA binding protein
MSSKPEAPQSLLTVEELATALRLHPKTIYRLVEQGKLACIRIGRNIRFSPDVLTQLTKKGSCDDAK